MMEQNPRRVRPRENVHFSPETEACENVGEIIQTCRHITIDTVKELLRDMFEHADDTLFDMAERAGSNFSQTRYFDSMRELRRRRHTATSTFRGEVEKEFRVFAERKWRPAQTKQVEDDITEGDLELVDRDEYEETLAISSMVNRAQGQYLGELHALNQRFSVLSGGIDLDSEDNPAGPARLCEAFRVAIEPFDLDVQARIVVYKLFERFVVLQLRSLYRALNKSLVEAGILPEIHSKIKHPHGELHHPRDAASDESGATAQPTYADERSYMDGGTNSEEAQILDSIETLLATRHLESSTPAAQRPAPDGVGAGGVPTGSLLNALGSLQVEEARGAPQDRALNQTELKQLVTTRLSDSFGDSVPAAVASRDEDTIDLVGMLFEFIVEDRNLPAPIQVTLTRLQIPYLKVALTSRRFFVQRNHPARKLLDDMARAGIGWTRENEKSSGVLVEIQGIVDRILNEFEDNLELFRELAEGFAAFTARQERVRRVVEKHATEAAEGRERLRLARRDAFREILLRLEEPGLPTSVRRFLAKPWGDVLKLTAVRYGQDSEEWERRLKVADDVIWGVMPKRTSEEQTALLQLLPSLTEAIDEGLRAIGKYDEEIAAVRDELVTRFNVALNAPSAVEREVGSTPEAAAAIAEPIDVDASDNTAKDKENREIDAESDTPAASLDIPIGTWFEITEHGHPTRRARLSLVNPVSQRYLLVSQKGLIVAYKPPADLAAGLEDGSIRMLESEPLLDRALGSIKQKLDRGEAGLELEERRVKA